MANRPSKDPAVDQTIGRLLKAKRISKGVTQSVLGDAVGVTFQQIQKYEKGSNRVSVSRLIAICGALKTNPAVFIDTVTRAIREVAK